MSALEEGPEVGKRVLRKFGACERIVVEEEKEIVAFVSKGGG